MKFEVRLSKFEFDLDFWAKVRQVRSSNMPEFGSSKFENFEFVPPLLWNCSRFFNFYLLFSMPNIAENQVIEIWVRVIIYFTSIRFFFSHIHTQIHYIIFMYVSTQFLVKNMQLNIFNQKKGLKECLNFRDTSFCFESESQLFSRNAVSFNISNINIGFFTTTRRRPFLLFFWRISCSLNPYTKI